VFRQIYRDRDYDLRRYAQHERIDQAIYRALADGLTPVIVDAGANIGAAALFFSSAYPRATVIAVEPDPSNAQACRTNTAGRANIRLIQAAVGAVEGHVDLDNPGGQAWAIQTRRSSAGAVPVCTIEQVVATVPNAVPIIVKVDIEGFEADLFAQNTGWIDRATAVVVEPHDWLFPDRKTSRSFQRAMAERDFDVVLAGENLVYFRGQGAATDPSRP